METKRVVFFLDSFWLEKLHFEILGKKFDYQNYLKTLDIHGNDEETLKSEIQQNFPGLRFFFEFYEHTKLAIVIYLPVSVILMTKKKFQLFKRESKIKCPLSLLSILMGCIAGSLALEKSEQKTTHSILRRSIEFHLDVLNGLY